MKTSPELTGLHLHADEFASLMYGLMYKPMLTVATNVSRSTNSQRSGETQLETWIVAKEDGEVVTAHCNYCMAG